MKLSTISLLAALAMSQGALAQDSKPAQPAAQPAPAQPAAAQPAAARPAPTQPIKIEAVPPPSGAANPSAPPPPPPPPPFVAPAAPSIQSTDADVKAVVALLNGSFLAPAAGSQPARFFHGATVNVDGLDNAVYFELTRQDSPQAAFRQGIFHIFKQTMADGKQTTVLRVLDFAKLAPTFGNAIGGLWTAPEYFPAIKVDQLSVNADIALAKRGEAYAGSATMVPTTAGGATYFSSTIELAKTGINWVDTGIDASGKGAWGGKDNSTFAKVAAPITADKRDNGLVVIDLVTGPADAIATSDGSELYMQYTGWIAADGLQFDSSRLIGRDPLRMMLPGTLIQGWNLGIPGIKLGGTRKMIIPGSLGYGDRGNPRARIPSNATLIFETECVFHKPGVPLDTSKAKTALPPPASEP